MNKYHLRVLLLAFVSTGWTQAPSPKAYQALDQTGCQTKQETAAKAGGSASGETAVPQGKPEYNLFKNLWAGAQQAAAPAPETSASPGTPPPSQAPRGEYDLIKNLISGAREGMASRETPPEADKGCN